MRRWYEKFEELAKQAEYLFREVEQGNLNAADAQTVLSVSAKLDS